MKILVTGGAGFIGSVATAALLQAGHRVLVFDNLSTGHRRAADSEAQFLEGDLRDSELVDRTLRAFQPDAVMHFAARSLVGESVDSPLRYMHDNVHAGFTLLEAMVRHNVGKFVFSSTANLFAEPEKVPIDEDARITPGSPYGESKLTIERALPWLEKAHGIRYAILRYFNAAGATKNLGEDHRPETHLIPLVLQVAIGQRAHIEIFGDDYSTRDGTCERDYVHVADLAEAHLLVLDTLDVRSCVYHLGSERGSTVLEVIQAAREITGQPIPAVVSKRRPGDVDRLLASSQRIVRELGWRGSDTTLESIIGSAWDWMRQHPQGYA